MSAADAEAWLHFAEEDLAAAKLLVRAAKPPGRVACFHAQQAVEKALKAMLIAEQREFPFTHDLDVLGALQGEPLRSRLDAFDLAPLRMFAVQSRYPADAPEVTVEAAEAMIDLAEMTLTVTRERCLTGRVAPTLRLPAPQDESRTASVIGPAPVTGPRDERHLPADRP